MIALKKSIFTEVRKNTPTFGDLSDSSLDKLLFHHRDGLRLTSTGLAALRKQFTAYSFEIPETIKSKHRLGMSKMEYPYFFTRRKLILFSEMDAMVIKLHGGVEGFLEACSQIE